MKTKLLCLLTAIVFFAASAAPTQAADPENMLVMQLEYGNVIIELLPDVAPNHVARIKELTRQGFYDGVVFHRVIDGFMAQTGDPTGTGSGGSGQNINAEFSQTPFVRGTLGMARANDPDSADSQFFIMFADGSFLNGKYTVFGKVTQGMEFVDMIKRGEPPADPDKLVKMAVVSDMAAAATGLSPSTPATPAAP